MTTAISPGLIWALVHELDPGERAVSVDCLDHASQGGDVLLVPEPRLGKGTDVAAVVDLAFLGADRAPAAFGLDAAQRRLRAGVAVAHAGAMGHLVEAVFGRHRPDGNRLEENIVTRVARHDPAYQRPDPGPIAAVGRRIGKRSRIASSVLASM